MREAQHSFLSRFFEPVSDAEPMGLGTTTLTKVRSEEADTDVHNSLILGTQTLTGAGGEQADADPDSAMLATRTITNTSNEGTDNDPGAIEFGPWVSRLI